MRRPPRRRAANGRPNRVNVSLTDQQYATWKAAADREGITLPHWILDQVEGKPPTMITRALITEIGGIRLAANGVFGNLNQLSRSAHVGGFDPAGWLTTTASVRRVVGQIETWITDHQ